MYDTHATQLTTGTAEAGHGLERRLEALHDTISTGFRGIHIGLAEIVHALGRDGGPTPSPAPSSTPCSPSIAVPEPSSVIAPRPGPEDTVAGPSGTSHSADADSMVVEKDGEEVEA